MFYLVGKDQNGKYLVKDSSDNVTEAYTKGQLAKIEDEFKVKILGMSYDFKARMYKFIPVRIRHIESFFWLVEYEFIPWLKLYGIKLCEEVGYSEDTLTFETRFLGGYGAWSGDEDLCDADTLDKEVYKAVVSACKSFEENTGVKVSFHTGEKAWTYFEFS